MKYELVKLMLNSLAFVDISEDEYLQIESAQKNLLEALFIEEKFDVVIENYLEWEMSLLTATTRNMLWQNPDVTSTGEERSLFNRRLVNLLSACRLYRDQVSHHLSNIFSGKSDTVAKIKEYAALQYGQCLGYRAMEALRNYVQHRGFPIHTVTYGVSRLESKSRSKLRFSLTPYIRVEDLERDGNFKKPVLKELQQLGNSVDLKPLVREYVASLGNIHEEVRGGLGAYVREWEQALQGAIARFRNKHPEESLVGLAAAVRNDDSETYSQPVYLYTVEDLAIYRQKLERKNSNLSRLAERYVTSEVLEPNT